MLLKIHPETPSPRQISIAVETLKKGGIIIYPTDTVYGIGCDIYHPKAIEKIARIKNLDLEKAHFSFICYDLSHLSDFTKQVDSVVFKLLKKNLPGPFTFILPANNNVPKIFKTRKKTVGIRIPDNNIAREIVKELGHPILTTSVISSDDIIEYITDPELLQDSFGQLVDIVIDGGAGSNIPSTIVDCTTGEAKIIRQGLGILEM
jgi:tRNA threonylcarbamoyl adenosine modification protein (Sua5/YciO/YrdC/YwlC family)